MVVLWLHARLDTRLGTDSLPLTKTRRTHIMIMFYTHRVRVKCSNIIERRSRKWFNYDPKCDAVKQFFFYIIYSYKCDVYLQGGRGAPHSIMLPEHRVIINLLIFVNTLINNNGTMILNTTGPGREAMDYSSAIV